MFTLAPRPRRRRGTAASASLLLWTTALVRPGACKDIPTLPIPERGTASLTHYDVPLGVVTSCGCSTNATYFPTAALSQAAYGSALASGPACGQCFALTLSATLNAVPQWVLSEEQRANISVVVKITDKCPALKGQKPEEGWCGATATKTNNVSLHFDLSSPSPSIPLSFFPTNATYGYDEFGGWLVDFERVSCERWAGWGNETARFVSLELSESEKG
ncbi:hypothetical protein JCM10450v2_003762 [Rhodotorula kratochvilovae]